jgi:uncharacterized membrane protein YhhN
MLFVYAVCNSLVLSESWKASCRSAKCCERSAITVNQHKHGRLSIFMVLAACLASDALLSRPPASNYLNDLTF